MELVILCLLSWPWTPGAAPSRGLDRARKEQVETQVGDLPGLAWGGAEGGVRPGLRVFAGGLKVTISQGAARRGSPRSGSDDPPDSDFTLVLLALSVAALVLISCCCFHQKCYLRLLSCLHPAWRGGMGHSRHLSRVLFISSFQHYGALASRRPQGLATESNWKNWPVSSALYSEPFVHYRRGSTGMLRDRSTSSSAVAPGNGTDYCPTSETVLEMEDEL